MARTALDPERLSYAPPSRPEPRRPRSPAAMLASSNLLTYAAVVAAVTAIWGASRTGSAVVGAAISAAVLADTFDGAFARRFTRSAFERSFGAQLDSLADAMVSGVAAPAAMALFVDGRTTGATALPLWAAAAVWAICAMTRLAWFNLSGSGDEEFIGLPTPVAALIVATTLLWTPGTWMAVIILLGGAAAMVAPIRIARPRGRALLLFALWPLSVLALHVAR